MYQPSLHLSGAEHGFLHDCLTSALRNLKIEEHRTRSPSFREHVTSEKELIEAILAKLEHSPSSRETEALA